MFNHNLPVSSLAIRYLVHVKIQVHFEILIHVSGSLRRERIERLISDEIHRTTAYTE